MVTLFWILAVISAAFLIANIILRPYRLRRAEDKRETAYSYNLSLAISVYMTFALVTAALVARSEPLFAIGWAVSPIVFTLFLARFFVWKRRRA